MILIFLILGTANEGSGTTLGGVPLSLALPFAFVVIAGFVAFAFTNWRCPACNKYLGKTFNPSFCPKCGVALR
jgi:rubrerythrin